MLLSLPVACFHILRRKNSEALSYWASAIFGEIQVLACSCNKSSFPPTTWVWVLFSLVWHSSATFLEAPARSDCWAPLGNGPHSLALQPVGVPGTGKWMPLRWFWSLLPDYWRRLWGCRPGPWAVGWNRDGYWTSRPGRKPWGSQYKELAQINSPQGTGWTLKSIQSDASLSLVTDVIPVNWDKGRPGF
jgi:hypothetical protein